VPNETCAADCAGYGRPPKPWPLTCVRGDDFPFQFRVNRDLAAYTLAADVTNATTGAVVCAFAITKTPIIVNGQTHTRVQLTLTDSQTLLIVPPQTYRWSFRWTTPGGDTRTVFVGRFNGLRR
jgi:hypothetical protein